MSYQITLDIAEDSEANRLIESVAATQQLSREEAALQLIEGAQKPIVSNRVANPDAYKIIGAFSSPEDVVLMDEVMEIIMEERKRRNSAPPRD